MPLKLLHLSDIHFKFYDKNGHLNLDKDLQNELLRDLTALIEKVGSLDVIIIGGDIAFSGSENEYSDADKWIENLCEATQCSVENVLCIPGNHDVEWSRIKPILEEAQQSFKSLRSRINIDAKLAKFLVDEASCDTLLRPFTNYNNFAQKYGVVPEQKNKLYWEKRFEIDDYVIRIRGVNSALVSNKSDDENTSKLILGTHQSQIVREEKVINLIVCHHPPDWLYDGTDARNEMLARAKILFFGHKHAFEVNRIDEALILSAGAMQPPRDEPGWDPRYNVLEIEVVERDNFSNLSVKIWKRVWKANKQQCFVPDYGLGGSEFEVHLLRCDPIKAPEIVLKEAPLILNDVKMKENDELINPKQPNPFRKLSYLFLSLPYHTKLQIAVDLGLISEDDKDSDEIKKAQAYLNRAKKDGKLLQLWDKINQVTPQKGQNPFK